MGQRNSSIQRTASFPSTAMDKPNSTSYMDEDTSEIQPNPPRQDPSLGVKRKNEDIYETQVPTHQKFLRKRWSMESTDVSENKPDSLVKRYCVTPGGDATLEALVRLQNDVTLVSPTKMRGLVPSDDVVAKVNKPSSWVVQKIAMVMKKCGNTVTWIKVHVLRQS